MVVRIQPEVKEQKASCCHGGQSFFDALKAMVARQLFLLHSFLVVWRVAEELGDRYWLLLVPCTSLLIETAVVLASRRGREWNWFQPSVFLYLCCAVPPIWLLELHHEEMKNNMLNATSQGKKVSGLQIALNEEEWLQALEQSLLVIIIVARWLIPKGDLSREQLSSLLLAHLGTASDIVDFYSMLSDVDYIVTPSFRRIILGFWSWSLLQFPFVVTSTRSDIRDDHHEGEDEVKLPEEPLPLKQKLKSNLEYYAKITFETEVWAIFVSIVVQDGPFVFVRLVAIIHYNMLTYTNYFFMAKNALVLTLQLYRIVSLYTEHKEAKERERKKHKEAWKAIKFYKRHLAERRRDDMNQRTFVF